MTRKEIERKKIVEMCKNLAIKWIKTDCFVIGKDMVELAYYLYYDDVLKIRENYFINDNDNFHKKEREKIKAYCVKYLGMSF